MSNYNINDRAAAQCHDQSILSQADEYWSSYKEDDESLDDFFSTLKKIPVVSNCYLSL